MADRRIAEIARFTKLKRWNLLTTLAWIATRDVDLAYKASRPDASISGADIDIVLSRRMSGTTPVYETVTEAWELELAPAVSEGKISGTGTLVRGGQLQFVETREAGLSFPPEDKPHITDHLEPIHRGDSREAVLAFKDSRFAHQWTDWADVVFSTDTVKRLWPATIPQPHLEIGGAAKLPPPDYLYLSQALADFIKFKAQHGDADPDHARAEMFDAIKKDELRVFIEDARGTIRVLPASDIAAAAERPMFMSIFGDRPIFQLSGSPLEPANGYRALAHLGNFNDWAYWVRIPPEGQARLKANAEEMERLKLIAEAAWVPPSRFTIADLEKACDGARPWLSLVVNFMTFGTPWRTPGPAEPDKMSESEVRARQAPAARLIFQSARTEANRLMGIVQGQREVKDIPAVTFDEPLVYCPDNIVRRGLEHLEMEAYVAERKNPTPDWTHVRLSWPHLKTWLISLGAETRDDDDTAKGQRSAVEQDLEQGRITPKEADAAIRVGAGKGAAYAPDPAEYAPEREHDWTIPMAVLWIAHRSYPRVVEGMIDWNLKAVFVRDLDTGLLFGPGELDDLPIAKGYRREGLWRPSLVRLLSDRPERARYLAAFDEMKKRFVSSNIKTFAIDASGNSIEVPSTKWRHLDPVHEEGHAEYFGAADVKSTERFYEVFVSREDVEREWGPSEIHQIAAPVDDKARRLGGRPPKYPWVEGFDQHLRQLFDYHGDFDPTHDSEWYQEAAIATMTTWCEDAVKARRWLSVPPAPTIRDRVQKVRREFTEKWKYGNSATANGN